MAYRETCNYSVSRAFHLELHDLEKQWRAAGFYQGDPWDVMSEVLVIAILWAACALFSHRWPMLGGACLGLSMLTGFKLAHQAGHNAGVFQPANWPSENIHFAVRTFIGNTLAGVDIFWWAKVHKIHHRYTMSQRDWQMPRSPEILPICAWDEASLANFLQQSPYLGSLLRFQEVFWLPMLLVSGKPYLSWTSYARGILEDENDPGGLLTRKLALAAHYVLIAFAAWGWVWRKAGDVKRSRRLMSVVWWSLACLAVASTITPMFFFNHIQTGVSSTTEADHKVSQMCHTVSYDISLPLQQHFVPVDHHIEHHIAPKIPDENLHRIAADIERLAQRHGLPYRVESLTEAMWKHTMILAGVPRNRIGGAVIPALAAIVVAVAARIVVVLHRAPRGYESLPQPVPSSLEK